MSKKSSEVLAEPTAIAERMGVNAVSIRYGEIMVTLKAEGLTYIQAKFVDAARQFNASFERNEKGEIEVLRYNPDAMATASQWILRLGIESVEGIPWTLERARIAGRDYQCVKAECLDKLPGIVQEKAEEQITRLTSLSHGEEQRLDFTSRSLEVIPASAMESSV